MTERTPPTSGPKRLPTGRFAKGASGNPRGRPKSRAGIDFEKIVDGLVPVKRNGALGAAPRKEAALARHFAVSMDPKCSPRKRLKAIAWLLHQFDAAGELKPALDGRQSGVMCLPNSMPWAMAQWMATNLGLPPFTPDQIAQGREHYVAARNAEQAEIDRLIAYPDLIEGEDIEADKLIEQFRKRFAPDDAERGEVGVLLLSEELDTEEWIRQQTILNQFRKPPSTLGDSEDEDEE